MILRTREHYENRIRQLTAKGETKNQRLIAKARREIRRLKNEDNSSINED